MIYWYVQPNEGWDLGHRAGLGRQRGCQRGNSQALNLGSVVRVHVRLVSLEGVATVASRRSSSCAAATTS